MGNRGIIQSAQQQSIQKTGEQRTMQQYIKSMESEIAKALPAVITPERFTRMTLSAISVNPKLANCTPKSFLGAMMTAAQLGLEPNTPLGQAYLIPRRNHGVWECQFQLGYKGLVDLAYRSGEVSIVAAHAVYENDEFDFELGLNPFLKHKPTLKNRGKAIAYYAMFKTKDGGFGFDVIGEEVIREFAEKKSPSYDNGPWQTDFDEMAKKTVLKSVLKIAPLKSDFVRELDQDETIKTTISEDMYSVPDEMITAEFVDVDAAEQQESGV